MKVSWVARCRTLTTQVEDSGKTEESRHCRWINGGAVNGPGGPKDDVIDAKLSDGEFVMTAKAVENLGGGDRLAGAKQMYNMMNQLDPQSETVGESVIGV